MNTSLEPGVKVEGMDFRLRVGIESYATHRIQHAGDLFWKHVSRKRPNVQDWGATVNVGINRKNAILMAPTANEIWEQLIFYAWMLSIEVKLHAMAIVTYPILSSSSSNEGLPWTMYIKRISRLELQQNYSFLLLYSNTNQKLTTSYFQTLTNYCGFCNIHSAETQNNSHSTLLGKKAWFTKLLGSCQCGMLHNVTLMEPAVSE